MSDEISKWIEKDGDELLTFSVNSMKGSLQELANTKANLIKIAEYKRKSIAKTMLLNAFIDREKTTRNKCE